MPLIQIEHDTDLGVGGTTMLDLSCPLRKKRKREKMEGRRGKRRRREEMGGGFSQ